jgi:hypothetical protein
MRGSVKEATQDGNGKFLHVPGSFMGSQQYFFESNMTRINLTAVTSSLVILIPTSILDKPDFPRKTLARIERFTAAVALKLACYDFPHNLSNFDFEDWLNFVLEYSITVLAPGNSFDVLHGALLITGDIEEVKTDDDSFSRISFVKRGVYKCNSLVKLILLPNELIARAPKISNKPASSSALLTLRCPKLDVLRATQEILLAEFPEVITQLQGTEEHSVSS